MRKIKKNGRSLFFGGGCPLPCGIRPEQKKRAEKTVSRKKTGGPFFLVVGALYPAGFGPTKKNGPKKQREVLFFWWWVTPTLRDSSRKKKRVEIGPKNRGTKNKKNGPKSEKKRKKNGRSLFFGGGSPGPHGDHIFALTQGDSLVHLSGSPLGSTICFHLPMRVAISCDISEPARARRFRRITFFLFRKQHISDNFKTC